MPDLRYVPLSTDYFVLAPCMRQLEHERGLPRRSIREYLCECGNCLLVTLWLRKHLGDARASGSANYGTPSAGSLAEVNIPSDHVYLKIYIARNRVASSTIVVSFLGYR